MHENSFSVVLGVVGGFLSYCFDISPMFEVLLWAITLDIIIGVMASFINVRLQFNSKRMTKGICKKIILLSLVAFSHHLDIMMQTDIICRTVTCFFIANDGLSCLENAGKCGLKLPKILANSLEQLKGVTDNDKHKKT